MHFLFITQVPGVAWSEASSTEGRRGGDNLAWYEVIDPHSKVSAGKQSYFCYQQLKLPIQAQVLWLRDALPICGTNPMILF